MSDSHELKIAHKNLCDKLPSNLQKAALVHLVGSAAGLNMAIDPVTNEPRSLSAATELTDRFIEDATSKMRNESPTKYELEEPPYFAIVQEITRKAAAYKEDFAQGRSSDNERGR